MVKISGIFLAVLLFTLAGESRMVKGEQFVDPMRPVRYQPAAVKVPSVDQKSVNPETWKLTAVLISAQRAVAVINGQSLQEGDAIDGYRLVQIETDKVLLKNQQQKLELRRAGTGLKKISTGEDVGKGSKP